MRTLAFVLMLSIASSAHAQSFTRRRVAAGAVTGIEMGIEGTLTGVPGGRVRWFLTVYEVLERRDLRIAPDARITVTASYARAEPVATAVADANGMADVAFDLPDDLAVTPSIEMLVVAGDVRRVFNVPFELGPRHAVELYTDRARTGDRVLVFGRVVDRARSRPAASVAVTVTADGRAPIELRTDERGVFMTTRVLLDRGRRIIASTEAGQAERHVAREPDSSDVLAIEATAARRVVSPGATVPVEVRVRDRDRAPVRGAVVRWAEPAESEPREVRTDASGRAVLEWHVDPVLEEPFVDRARAISVTAPAHGTGRARARVRVARRQVFYGVSVEGGALARGLLGRVYVRAFGADGAPLANEAVALELPGWQRLASATDRSGAVAFEGRLGRDAAAGCGPTAVPATIELRGLRETSCIAIDPDATVAVRAERADGAIRVALERTVSAPVEIVALRRVNGRWLPLVRTLVPQDRDETSIALPELMPSAIWIRARPLRDGRFVRGASTLVWNGPGAPSVTLRASGEGATFEGVEGSPIVYVMDANPGSFVQSLPPISRAFAEGATDLSVRALLATYVPRDRAASLSIRDGVAAIEPMPNDPVALGLLRDPWRTRARFLRGRVGRLMRAVEDYVDSQIPEHPENVFVREGGAHRFNLAILEGAIENVALDDGVMDEESLAALDGEPIDLAALVALDRAFDFDHVARRVTRKRLWKLLVGLRRLVRDNQIDADWARRGEIGDLLPNLVGVTPADEWGESIVRRDLYDAWGRPFVLRRGQARFSFLEPLPGYELVSAGPDGRAGTRDDLVDPFERVLPDGGVYAEAVGEDALLARLRGVVVDRATLEALAGLFGVDTYGPAESEEPPLVRLPVPPRIEDYPEQERVETMASRDVETLWGVTRARSEYVATAVDFRADGSIAVARERFTAGAPWVVSFDAPIALRPGDRLRLPVSVVALADETAPDLTVETSGRAIAARLDGRTLEIGAVQPGFADVIVRAGEAGLGRRIRVVPDGVLRARHAGAVVRGTTELDLALPGGARPWRAELVIGRPNALARDPMFEALATDAPSIAAWARVMSGDSVEPEIEARLGGERDPLRVACAAAVWTSLDDPAGARRERREAALAALRSIETRDLATGAAVLAALAPAMPGRPDTSDPTAALLERWRQEGWRALATASDRPAIMARVAAALLLADAGDSAGRALAARAVEELEEDEHGRSIVPGDPEVAADSFIGTLALAIALRQSGDDALAAELADSAFGRIHAATWSAEATFWALAASVYGALGVASPSVVIVEAGGAERRVALENGVAIVPIDAPARVRVRAPGAIFARTESRYIVAREAREGVLAAQIEGSLGRRGERAGIELVVRNTTEDRVPSAVVDITLPSAARFDDDARAAIERSSVVASVEPPDGAGVVRIRLAPIAGDGAVRVPIPVRWIASGSMSGFSIAASDESRPTEASFWIGPRLEMEERR
jgi:hypothetical protein